MKGSAKNNIMSILLSIDRINKREFYYLEQDGEFILYFLQDGKRNFYPTLFTSLTDLIAYYLFATSQEVPAEKVLFLASVIITSRQRPRSIESAIIKALKVEAIREAMKEGTVIFSFCKTNGVKRVAKGTTNFNLIPTEKQPKGDSTRKKNPLQIYFYDVAANASKSFLASNIIY